MQRGRAMFVRSCILYFFLFCSPPVDVLSEIFDTFRYKVLRYVRPSEFIGRRCVSWKVILVRRVEFVCPRQFCFEA